MPVEPQDYDATIEALKRQRDQALFDLEQAKLVSREVLAMERLGMGISITYLAPDRHEAPIKWNNLVEMAQKVVAS